MFPLGQGFGLETTPKLSRRSLLIRGMFGTSALIVTLGALRAADRLKARPAEGRKSLSDPELKILSTVSVVLFPGADGMPPADPDQLIPSIDTYLSQSAESVRFLFRAMLHVIEEQPLFFRGRVFSRCSPEVQREEIRAWDRTRLYVRRAAFQSFKLVIGMAYFEHPDVREAIGWSLGCVDKSLSGGAVS